MVYTASSLRSLGVTQIIIGVLMVIFGIASLAAIHHWSSYIACGLWVGVRVVLTGLFGYLGSKSDTTPNNCLIGLMIGFAATACVFTGVMFIIYCVALSQFSQQIRCGQHGDGIHVDCYLYDYEHLSYNLARAGAGVGAILLVLALVEFFVALASSISGCNATCCGVSSGVVQSTQQVTYLNQAGNNLTVVNASQGAVLSPGPTFQTTCTTYPGQPTTVIQTAHSQVIPGAVQTYNTYPIQQGVPVVQQQGYINPPPPYTVGMPPQ